MRTARDEEFIAKCSVRRRRPRLLEKLSEPHATLVLFLAVTGLRIGEAIAIKWSDFEGDVLHVQRRMYDGKVDTTKSRESKRRIPIPAALLKRLKALGNTASGSSMHAVEFL